MQGWKLKFDSTCHFGQLTLTVHSPVPVFTSPKVDLPPPFVFPCVTRSFRSLFVLFLVSDFRNSRNIIFPHFDSDQVTPVLNLPGECALIRVLGKQFTYNVIKHVAEGVLLLQWKIQIKDLKPQENTMEVLYTSSSFFFMNLCGIFAVCEKTCQFFPGTVLGRHVYPGLITYGSIVTSSITLFEYMGFVINTRGKPYMYLSTVFTAFQHQFIRQFGI